MEEKMSGFKKGWKRFYGVSQLVGFGVDFLCSEVGARMAGEVANKLMPGAGFATVLGAKIIGRGIGVMGSRAAKKDFFDVLEATDKLIDKTEDETEETNDDSEVKAEVVTE